MEDSKRENIVGLPRASHSFDKDEVNKTKFNINCRLLQKPSLSRVFLETLQTRKLA